MIVDEETSDIARMWLIAVKKCSQEAAIAILADDQSEVAREAILTALFVLRALKAAGERPDPIASE